MPWWLAAILSAFFAGMVGVLAKAGFGVSSKAARISPNLGTALRLLVILPLAWLVVSAEGSFSQIHRITQRQWIFLFLSALGTGLSWLFYFVAISKGDVNRVNPIDKASLAVSFILAVIFLHEKITWQSLTATLLVLAALFISMIKSPASNSAQILQPPSTTSTTITPSAPEPPAAASPPSSEPRP